MPVGSVDESKGRYLSGHEANEDLDRQEAAKFMNLGCVVHEQARVLLGPQIRWPLPPVSTMPSPGWVLEVNHIRFLLLHESLMKARLVNL